VIKKVEHQALTTENLEKILTDIVSRSNNIPNRFMVHYLETLAIMLYKQAIKQEKTKEVFASLKSVFEAQLPKIGAGQFSLLKFFLKYCTMIKKPVSGKDKKRLKGPELEQKENSFKEAQEVFNQKNIQDTLFDIFDMCKQERKGKYLYSMGLEIMTFIKSTGAYDKLKDLISNIRARADTGN
jgi:hypothetical protein